MSAIFNLLNSHNAKFCLTLTPRPNKTTVLRIVKSIPLASNAFSLASFDRP